MWYTYNMKKIIQFSITNEDGLYVASGINTPIVTDGKTFEELQKRIEEAVSLYLEERQNEFVKSPAIIANFEFTNLSYA